MKTGCEDIARRMADRAGERRDIAPVLRPRQHRVGVYRLDIDPVGVWRVDALFPSLAGFISFRQASGGGELPLLTRSGECGERGGPWRGKRTPCLPLQAIACAPENRGQPQNRTGLARLLRHHPANLAGLRLGMIDARKNTGKTCRSHPRSLARLGKPGAGRRGLFGAAAYCNIGSL